MHIAASFLSVEAGQSCAAVRLFVASRCHVFVFVRASCAVFFRFAMQFLRLKMSVYGGSTVPPGGGGGAARQATDGLWTEVCGQQKQSNDPGNNQHILNTPTTGRR